MTVLKEFHLSIRLATNCRNGYTVRIVDNVCRPHTVVYIIYLTLFEVLSYTEALCC